MNLVTSVLDGDRLALARLLTQVENNLPEGLVALNQLFSHTGKAHLVGVTGAPGTGKSSLVNKLALYYRSLANPRKIGIVAVDPSSPFSGGAILGDRVRMRDLAGDSGVFIRSMASRGSLGGLAITTSGLVQVLDAAGYEIIFIETVGAGQAEVDIARQAHTTLVIEAPGFGDDIQVIKAGILEIADIIVINKADQPGVENTARALKGLLQLAAVTQPDDPSGHHMPEMGAIQKQPEKNSDWQVCIQRTIAIEGDGVKELADAIDRHRLYLRQSGLWQQRERQRLQADLESLLHAKLMERWRSTISEKHYQQAVDSLIKRQTSPLQAVESLLEGSNS
jgi:LAO/AO transport system kinase